MSKLVLLATALLVVVSALPNTEIDFQNVVTVPPNCPAGQEYINGECRDVWKRSKYEQHIKINVLPNCSPDQRLINGLCRDVWMKSADPKTTDIWHQNIIDTNNVVTVPPNCPDGQQWINGQCRDIWKQSVEIKNVVTVPPNCPSGQQFVNGQCRDIWRQTTEDTTNMVPSNCPDGQQYLNGQCKDVWTRQKELESHFATTSVINRLQTWIETLRLAINSKRTADEANAEIQNRNIISVPNSCPSGYLPDSLGICRPIFG